MELHDVVLLDFPPQVWARSRERHDGLMREFALISWAQPEERSQVPARLRALVERLESQYGGFTTAQGEQMRQAANEGVDRVDLRYSVPADLAPATAELLQILEAADAFCEEGALLTLAPTPLDVAFRRWFLGEFQRQIAGEAPRPWPGPWEPPARP